MVDEDSVTSTDEIKREIQSESGSKTGMVGVKHTYFINNNIRFINSLAVSTRRPYFLSDSVINDQVTLRLFKNEDTENRLLASSKIYGKLNSKNSFSAGICFENYLINTYHQDSEYFNEEDSMVIYDPYEEENGNLNLIQGYLQWKHRFNNYLTLNTGLHYQHFLFVSFL